MNIFAQDVKQELWRKIKMICWFCNKGIHKHCMLNIPVDEKIDCADCSFDTKFIQCECEH